MQTTMPRKYYISDGLMEIYVHAFEVNQASKGEKLAMERPR